jgi:hypothetical protein
MIMNDEPQPVVYSWNISCPALPFSSLLNSVVMLLNTYNVYHDALFDPTCEGGFETGNASIDERIAADWMSLKMFLDGLNREYGNIQATVQGTGIGLYMKFECR